MTLPEQHESIELFETLRGDQVETMPTSDEAAAPLLRDGRDQESGEDTRSEEEVIGFGPGEPPFSWIAYFVFLLLGIAMLWSWNMFLAAAPYFQRRFRNDPWILNHFQPAEILMFTFTGLIWMLILSHLQRNASYPRRIVASLLINMAVFAFLAVSTYTHASPQMYLGFLLLAVFVASSSTALLQNGAFAFTAGFGRDEYTQASMTGQAIAGVLPPLTQMISIAAAPARSSPVGDSSESSKSAFIYFMTATGISGVTMVAFFYLLRQQSRSEASDGMNKSGTRSVTEDGLIADEGARRSVPLTRLLFKIPYFVAAIILCFAITMVYPVFTAVIQSVSGVEPAIFISTGFLLWNVGDLVGRLLTLSPRLLLTHHPFALFCLAMARLLFIPLYFLCNIKGRGAAINSDLFYLIIVQLLFGITNGYLGSNCMIGAGHWVAPDEREAVGGFMALCLVLGLTIGSSLSFILGDI